VNPLRFDHGETIALLRQSVQDFAAKEIAPRAARVDQTNEFPPDLWPKLGGGFGSKINAGKVDDLNSQIEGAKNALYLAEARTWLVQYPKEALPKASNVYSGAVLTGMEAGFVALYQKCVHLGCRVPFCETSQWFECPCHGSQYNRVGEKKGGPAPRGLDRFAVAVTGGNLIIDTGSISLGPAIGTNTTGQEAEGPHCITSAGGH